MPETLTPEQVERIRQLPDGADQTAIDAALRGDTAPAPAAEVETPPVETPPAAPEPVAAAARLPAGLRVIDEATLADLRTKAEAGARLAADLAEKDKAETIATAIRERRIAPGRREAMELRWDSDPEGTRHLLTADPADGGLEPGVIPGPARSHASAGTVGGEGGDAYAALSAKATELRKTDPSLTAGDALKRAIEQNPDLAERYSAER